MAREQHERENLLRDAVAFTRRVEFRTSDGKELFIGFRPSGAVSVYVDQDPVYHFNSDGALRRAFIVERLLKAEQGRLVEMHRERPGGEVQLVSHVMSSEAASNLLDEIRRQLNAVLDDLERNRLRVVGQVPDDGDLSQEVAAWVTRLLGRPLAIAESPHAR